MLHLENSVYHWFETSSNLNFFVLLFFVSSVVKKKYYALFFLSQFLKISQLLAIITTLFKLYWCAVGALYFSELDSTIVGQVRVHLQVWYCGIPSVGLAMCAVRVMDMSLIG